MKILHVNTFDRGGAAIACIRLHDSLIEFGVESNLLLRVKTKEIRNTRICSRKVLPRQRYSDKIIAKIHRLGVELKLFAPKKNSLTAEEVFLSQRPHGLEYFSFPKSNYDITENSLYHEADIIHFHWVADFLDWPSFFTKNTKPIVWTLHDQNPFLGGQHYDERYLGINDLGLPCPRIKKEIEILKEDELIKVKNKVLNGKEDIHIVAPSKWLFDSSLRSNLFGRFNPKLITYGIPTNIFKSLDREFCRDVLELPINKKVILFVADSIENTRKGYVYLKRALTELSDDNFNSLVLCSIGKKSELEKNTKVIELGKIQDERLMAMTYAAADLFVIPSLEDNLPNTMLESLCCGTPVLGFPTGGIKDVIEEGFNGFLCEEISVNGLVKGLSRFLNEDVVFDRDAISRNASERFALEKQAKTYIELYNEILIKKE